MDEIVVVVQPDQARVNVTWSGENGDLPDAIHIDTPDEQVRTMVEEVIRTGGIPGIPMDAGANLRDFKVDRFPPTVQRPWHLFQVRPKTAYGA